MRTLGIDFAAQPQNTAACTIVWRTREAVVETVAGNVDDQRFLSLVDKAQKIGIDVPFGWPDEFVSSVTAHHAHQRWPGAETQSLRYRRTDLFVHHQTGFWPLSVSTDRIGITAFRAARLLSGVNNDRTGRGRFVEVYPRASLTAFGIDATLASLLEGAPWLRLDTAQEELCAAPGHYFDALIASLTARASELGLCAPIPNGEEDTASREGWIAYPEPGSLTALIGS
jgi:predicted nuclease with RNAse H fold